MNDLSRLKDAQRYLSSMGDTENVRMIRHKILIEIKAIESGQVLPSEERTDEIVNCVVELF